MKKYIFIIILFVIINPPLVLAMGEQEYLLEGEQIGNKLLSFDINNQAYSIYDIQNKQLPGFIVIGPSNQVPEEGFIKKSLFGYYTIKYISDNQSQIRKSYQEVYYDLDKNSRSSYQTILNAFKLVPEVCVKIPHLEIISACVRPTEKIEIMKIGGVFLIDWDVALDNYKKLGGEIMAITEAPYSNYETLIGFYEDYAVSEVFLEKAGLINKYNILKTEELNNYVSDNTLRETSFLIGRIAELRFLESNKSIEANKLLEDIKVSITKIAEKNGIISDINNKRKNLINNLGLVNLKDNYYSSDINHLNGILNESNNLELEVNNRLINVTRDYSSENEISQIRDSFLGFFKAIFV